MKAILRKDGGSGFRASVLAAAGLLASGSFAAASFISVPTIDPGGDANNVDQHATHLSSSGAATAANVVDLPTFRAAVSAAFALDHGGVIDFETRNDAGGTPTGSLDSTTAFTGRYGAGGNAVSGAKSLQVTTGNGTWVHPGATTNGRTPTSGTVSLGKNATDAFQFLLGSITNGADGERVTAFGFTVLERSGTDLGSTLKATATFSDGSTAVAQAGIGGTLPASNEDSFYGFTAPAGTSISSVFFDPGNFTTVDDVAFVTAIPDPTVPEPTAACAGLAGAALLLRRSRRH